MCFLCAQALDEYLLVTRSILAFVRMACADGGTSDLEDIQTAVEVSHGDNDGSCGLVKLQPRKSSRKVASEEEVRNIF